MTPDLLEYSTMVVSFDYGSDEDDMVLVEGIEGQLDVIAQEVVEIDDQPEVVWLKNPNLLIYQLVDDEPSLLASLENANIYLNQYQAFDKYVSEHYPNTPLIYRKACLIDAIVEMRKKNQDNVVLWLSTDLSAVREMGFSLDMVLEIFKSHQGIEKLKLIDAMKHKLMMPECKTSPRELTKMAADDCLDLNHFKFALVKVIAHVELLEMGFTGEMAANMCRNGTAASLASLYFNAKDCVALGLSCQDVERLMSVTNNFNFETLRHACPVLEPLLKKKLIMKEDILNIISVEHGDQKLSLFIKKWSGDLTRCHRLHEGVQWPEGTLMQIIAKADGKVVLDEKLRSSYENDLWDVMSNVQPDQTVAELRVIRRCQ